MDYVLYLLTVITQCTSIIEVLAFSYLAIGDNYVAIRIHIVVWPSLTFQLSFCALVYIRVLLQTT